MGTNRIEAFSDGVIAIIITIMVLELKVPHDTSPAVLIGLWPQFLSYALSFLVVAIMWVNHHHLLHIAKHANAALLWSNNNLLFWMSLIPFVTAYMGDNHAMPFAVAIYGAVLALCGTAFGILRQVITRQRAEDARLTAHNRRINRKNWFSATLYASSAPLAYVSVYLSFSIFILIPVLYFMPERALEQHQAKS